MGYMPIIGVIVLATVVASCTDWLFMDRLINRFYQAHAATWRSNEGTGRIIVSQLLGTMATAAAVMVCLWAHGRPVEVAAVVWCGGALPMALQNLQWMNIHPAITASQLLGWLIRLLIATCLTSLILVH